MWRNGLPFTRLKKNILSIYKSKFIKKSEVIWYCQTIQQIKYQTFSDDKCQDKPYLFKYFLSS